MIILGIDPLFGRLDVYDDEKKKQTALAIKKIPQSQVESSVYEKLFAQISLRFPNIEYVCLEVYSGYSNKMRKMMLEKAYAHGFPHVEMVGCPAALFLRITTQFDVDFKPGDIVWVHFDNTMHIFRNIKRRFQRLNIIWLRDLNQAKETPNYVFLRNGYHVFKNLIEKRFPKCYVKVIDETRSEGGLLKARISAGHEHLQKYDCYPAVQDTIKCFIENRKILEIPAEQILPLKRVIPVLKEKDDKFLDIRLDKYLETYDLPPENAFTFEFIVDKNGIYSFNFLKYEPDNVILRSLDREWIDVPNLPTTYENLKGFNHYEKNMDIVGIDLGMSKCCLAVGRNDGIQMAPLGNTGSYSLPSYISFRQKEPLCGEIAFKDLQNHTNFTVFDVKRIIGREYADVNINRIWPFKIIDAGDEPVIRIERKDTPMLLQPSHVSAALLKHIKKAAQEFQGRELKHVVITVPAAFTFSQKRDTLEAAKIAGWEKTELLLEPIAAAFAYFHNTPISTKKTVLLFDLGGGTLDLSIFKISNTKLTTIINNGSVDIGGRDFDMVLFYYFFEKLLNEFKLEMFPRQKYRLMQECQEIKHRLSYNESDSLDIEMFDITKEGYITVTQKLFENLSKEILLKIKNLVMETLGKANFVSNQIEMVILSGGGCRMPMIRAMLKDMFPGAKIHSQKNVEEVVAFGAAQYASVLLKTTSKDKCSIM